MTNPINMNNFSQSLNIATATGDEVVSLDKHITTSATDTDQIQAFIVSTWMASFQNDMYSKDWICPYISRHLLSLNPLLACCRRYSRGER
ncbi:hypothetical protein MZV35_20645 [Escherichia coli]